MITESVAFGSDQPKEAGLIRQQAELVITAISSLAGMVATSALFSNYSRLLTYGGWGHTAFVRSACVTEHVIAYLLEGTLPPEGTVCPANPNPFLASSPAARVASVSATRVGAGEPLVGLPPPSPALRGP